MSLHRFLGKHRGATAYLFGKGPSLDQWLEAHSEMAIDWKKLGTVRMVVNEAVLVVPEPHYFFAHDVLGIDRSMDAMNHSFRNGEATLDPHVQSDFPKRCVAIVRDVHKANALKHAVDPASVYCYRKAQMEGKLLSLPVLELAKSGALYAESATIQSACHFAKLTGCARVVLVGVDGGTKVASVFKNMGCAKGPWYTKNRGDTHRILEQMGMPFTVWGE